MKDLVKFFGTETIKLSGVQGFRITVEAGVEFDKMGRMLFGDSYYLRLENASIIREWNESPQVAVFRITTSDDLTVVITYVPRSNTARVDIWWTDAYEYKYDSDYAMPSTDRAVLCNDEGYVFLHHSHEFKDVESIRFQFVR